MKKPVMAMLVMAAGLWIWFDIFHGYSLKEMD